MIACTWTTATINRKAEGMAVERPFDPDDAQLGDGLSLVVVERPTRATYSLAEIKAASAVQDELVAAWTRTLEMTEDTDLLVDYTPDLVLRGDDPEIPVLNSDLSSESEIVADLLAEDDLPQESPKAVSNEHLYLYAAISDTVCGRIAMVKKQTPAKQARSGKWWAMAGDELRVMDDDPWQFHPVFDLVISEEGAYVLRYSALEQLLADSSLVLERVDDWVTQLAQALPLKDDGAITLVSRCIDSSRLRRRLRAIYDRGHLQAVDIATVREHASHMGFDPDDFIEDDQLVISDDNAEVLLQLLNEDLFNGGLTGEAFRSDGKAPLA